MKLKVLLYSEFQSPRLRYVLDFIQNIWNVEIEVTNDQPLISSSPLPKINYSNKEVSGVPVLNTGFLNETSIRDFDFSEIQEDAFSFIFFLLSRYEEYLDFKPDNFGRFPASASFLFKADKLDCPVVDNLIKKLEEELKEKYPDFLPQKREFTKQLTVDIDQVFKYREKSFKKFAGGAAKDFSKVRLGQLVDRKLSYFRLKKDPWDIYEELQKEFSAGGSNPVFFFQVGEPGELDKNLSPSHPVFRGIIKNTDKWAEVGLHPSFQSQNSLDILKKEKQTLEDILERPVTKSRNHYITLKFPETYRNLISAGITDDYTMGFPDATGFRAGTSQDFYWYDLKAERQTVLKIHPFCLMDVTLRKYLKMRWEHADFVLNKIEKNIKNVDGRMTVLLHNESLSGNDDWEDWDTVFRNFLHS